MSRVFSPFFSPHHFRSTLVAKEKAVDSESPSGTKMNTWLLVTLLLCLTKPGTTTDSEDVISVPEKSSNRTSIQSEDVINVPEKSSNRTSIQVTDERNETVTSELPEISVPHSAQPTDTQGPAVPSAAPAPTETPSQGNAPNEALECPDSSEAPTEQAHHTGSEEQPAGDCGMSGSPGEMQRLGNAITDFGMDLFKEILQETTKPNVVISPLSIALGLAQLVLGSVNRTEKQLQKTLHFNSLNCSHRVLRDAIDIFTQNVLSIASTIYIKKGFHIKTEFLEESEKFYKSRPQLLTGVNAKDTKMINKWVEQMTGGKIKSFLNEVPSNVVLLLLNAIHFKGLWEVQFDPRATSDDVFYMEDGKTVQVEMMQHPKYPISGFHDDDLQIEVARLSFKQNISFIVVKPMVNGRLDNVVQKLKISELLSRFYRARPMPVKVPKLNIDFDLDLSQALRSLGLGNLFMNPNLSKISSEPLIVSGVQHKATLELKEDGVEAAASTGIAVSRSFIQCNINRPFFFIIRDDIFGIPLFLGTIKDPKPRFRKDSQDKMEVNLERMRKVEMLTDPK